MKREIRQRRLRKLIDTISNGNVADFSRKVNKDQGYIARMLYPADKAGAKPIGEKVIDDISNVLNLPAGWFDNNEDLPNNLTQGYIVIDVLNVHASAGFGSSSELVEVVNQMRYVPDQFYATFRNMSPKFIRIINLSGDSMYPTFSSGDMLFVDISVNEFTGDGVYVFTYKGHLYVKRLQNTGDQLLVISDNKLYDKWSITEENQDQLFIHARVKVHQSQQLNFIG